LGVLKGLWGGLGQITESGRWPIEVVLISFQERSNPQSERSDLLGGCRWSVRTPGGGGPSLFGGDLGLCRLILAYKA
jgi:hypothetical protein